jgi:hypothetical protein
MGSLFLPTLVEERTSSPAATRLEPHSQVILATGFGETVAEDYLAYVHRQSGPSPGAKLQVADLSDPAAIGRLPADADHVQVMAVILFLRPGLTASERNALDALLDLAGRQRTPFVGVVSTFRVHLGDRAAAAIEDHVLGRLRALPARSVVFRPGHVLSPSSRASTNLRRFGFCYPLVPKRLHSCAVAGDELFAAIERERQGGRPSRGRVITLLGPNRSWQSWLAQHRSRGVIHTALTWVCALLALLFVGHLAALVLDLLVRRRPSWRHWNLHTLQPQSLRELLALVNPYNYRHVKVVGYNNGVHHFGQRFPGKTIVSTVSCNRVVWVGPETIKADCGATIHQAMDFLSKAGKELYVLPNFSYVCLGTSFFIPIHGSAADFSTVAETIVKVVLYDPAQDRLIVATRDDAAFREHVYNLQVDVLLLRLYVRVKPKSAYYVHRQDLDNPSSETLLSALRDRQATNVEIRKSSAASGKVQVSKYYKDPGQAQSAVLELPRDGLGRLWDRLEENAVTAFVMHALTRHFAWHVELFFTADEFATFWATHGAVPLRKIQLRYLHRDGLPHSPFRDHDCVSSDMFLLRRHRRQFETYLKQTFAVIRANPGKHSS